ncbi:MAG: FtsX-like permease family protein, partial [Candidatus Aminicenantes bacterium]
VVTVANMVVDRQSGEIALLRSRGATTLQILGVYFIEGLLIAAIGGIVGPFLGAAVFSLLGTTGPFTPLTGGGLLEIRFSTTVFALAAAAALVCLLALLLPAVRASRMGVVIQRQHAARPTRAPFWQRYYLDIALLVIGGVLYWELQQQGSLAEQSFFGGLELDPLVLVTPILFMVAAAIIFLRLFPLIIALAARLSRFATNAPVVLSLRYMARNPVHYGRLVLLLMLAASVGMFSASFLGTLERSYDERAKYVTGAELRLAGLFDSRSSKDAIVDRFVSVEGIEQVNVGFRGTATLGSLFTQNTFQMLAVDPVGFDEVAWFRDDFSHASLTELMAILEEDRPIQSGLRLPDGNTTVLNLSRVIRINAA